MSFYLKSNSIGSALISTLILLTVVSTLLIIFVITGKNNRDQITSYQNNHSLLMQINTIEDFAADVVMTDYQNSPQYTSTNENWKQITTIIPIGSFKVNINIEDLQSKLNINKLLIQNLTTSGAGSQINYIQLERMILLFEFLNIDQDLIYGLIDWIDSNTETISSSGAEDNYYLSKEPAYRSANTYLNNIDELLLIRGFNRKILNVLKPHLTAIDPQYSVNINTISEDTIRSLHSSIGLINAEKIIRKREKTPFTNVKEFALYLKYELKISDTTTNEITSMLSTNSYNYRVNGLISETNHAINFSTDIRLTVDDLKVIKSNRLIKSINII